MYARLLAIFAVLSFAVGSLGATDKDLVLKGTARSGAKPERDAVVWLEARGAAAPPAQKVIVYQRNLTFAPHVLAIRVGTAVDFPNDDRVFHNVFSFRDGKKFDLGIYPVGTRKRVVFSEPGVSRLFCNIHPNMAGYVVTVDSPYFSAADDRGTFTITGVPAGTYTYHAWRPGGPEITGSVTLRPETPLDISWP
jgi:plastocyanin